MINLVDLAGSEKVGKTGASGDRLKEAYGYLNLFRIFPITCKTSINH